MKTFDDTELPDEFLLALGRIVVAWNKLESHLLHTMAMAIIKDWSMYERAVAPFVHASFPQKLDALGAILRTIENEFADLYFQDVEVELKKAQKIRNAALHRYWHVHEGKVRRADVQARGEIKWELRPVTIQELKEGVLTIEKAFDCLFFISLPLSLHLKPHKGHTKES